MKENNLNHITIEKLSVKKWQKKIITYKSANFGVYVSFVDPRNTSRTCSACGKIDKELNLTKRIYNCGCGLSISRDYNACLNILNKIY